jgi:hypothetical protein
MTGGLLTGRPAAVALPVIQSESLRTRAVDGAAELLGLALLAGVLAAAVAFVYRWSARERVPEGLAILVGLSAVAVYLNTTRALGQVIGTVGEPFDETVAIFSIVTVLVSLGAARAGTNVGDSAGTDVFESTTDRVDSDVGRLVQAVGRITRVELPAEIDDIVGYDPIPEETKDQLAGKDFVFPRRLTVAELRDRLVTRLKADYAVGHVDIEVATDGHVEHLALGSRAAGIGPTLPPETSAVALRADPAFAASAGDIVQVWETTPPRRVLTAELRATADDVVTLAVDAADTRKLDDTTEYKLVTLPVEARPDREFTSLLRAADETMAAVTVAEGSGLVGQPVGGLAVTVVAVRPPDGPVEPLPDGDRRVAAGETLYLVATPETIRRVDGAASTPATAGAEPSPAAGSELPSDRRVDAQTPVVEAESPGPDPAQATPETDEKPAAGPAVEEESPTGAETDGDERPADRPESAVGPAVEELDDAEEAGDEATGGPADAVGEQAAVKPNDTPVEDSGVEPADEAVVPGDVDESADEGEGPVSDVAAGNDGADAAADTEADADQEAGSFDLGEPDLASVGDDGGPASQESDSAAESGGEGEPTTDDLEELPGTDPDELVGAGDTAPETSAFDWSGSAAEDSAEDGQTAEESETANTDVHEHDAGSGGEDEA